jgi:photosystem II stability/assembly factor-like uncharacterized protein
MHRGLVCAFCSAVISSAASSAPGETWGWSRTAAIPDADDVFRLLAASDEALYAATGPNGRVYKSTDGGAAWIPTAQLPGARQVYALLEGVDGVVYAGASPTGILYRTLDGGESWDVALNAPGASEVKSLARSIGGPLYAGTGPEGRVFAMRGDRGEWNETGDLAGAHYVYCLLAASDGAVYAGTDNGVFVTRDEGERWEATGGPPGVPRTFRLAEGDSGEIYAGCDGTVFVLRWDGPQWLAAGRVSPIAYAVFSFATVFDALFAGTGTDGAIHTPAPGGRGWRPVAAFEDAKNVYDLLAIPGGPAYAAVGGAPGGGAVLAFAPLLRLTPSSDAASAGDPLAVTVIVRPVAERFDAYVVLAGPAGLFSCAPGTHDNVTPGVRPFMRGVAGLAAPVSRRVLDLPAIPYGTIPGAWTIAAGLVPSGSPPAVPAAIRGFFDSRVIQIGPEDLAAGVNRADNPLLPRRE